LGIYKVERESEGSTIKNIGDAFWFAFTTITTTGYGDVYPVTAEGRIIGGILNSIGIAVILGFVSRYGTTLIEARAKSNVKDKIDRIKVLTREDISTLVAMKRS
jgi:voltage-gated potassium channel